VDPNYLKMVLALPDEFFERIKPRFGNLYWVETYQGWKEGYSRKTYAVCSIILDTGTYYLSLQDRKNMDEVVGSWEFEYNKRDKAIHWRKWLIPSQEQLQEMIKQGIWHDKELNDIDVLSSVIQWHTTRGTNHRLDQCSEYLFLEFLQWLNAQIWDGKEWL